MYKHDDPTSPLNALKKLKENPTNANVFNLPEHLNESNQESVKRRFRSYNKSLGYGQYIAMAMLFVFGVLLAITGWSINIDGRGTEVVLFFGFGLSILFVLLLAIYYLMECFRKNSGEYFLLILQGSMTRVWVTLFLAIFISVIFGLEFDKKLDAVQSFR